jgi:general secretion pathway protein D
MHNHSWKSLRTFARIVCLTGALACLPSFVTIPPAHAQTEVSAGYATGEEFLERLTKKADLTLRDTNFVEAMFVVRRVWGVNIVVGNELKGETVSCEYVDAPLHEILDSILLPRGYGYKPVGNSLVIIKLDSIGDLKPRFQSTTIPVKYADPAELERVATLYLSTHGKIQIIPSAKSLIVIDYPEQVLQVKAKIEEIDAAAKLVNDAEEEKIRKAEELAMSAANSAANGNGPAAVPGSTNKVAYFDLQYTKAEALAPAVQPLLNALGRVSVMTKDNRLIVYDTEEKLALIADAVRQLDVPRPQVRIAALIYDVSIEDIRRMGVNWGNTGGKGNNLTATGGAQDSAIFSALTAAAPAGANSSLTFTSLGSNFDLSMVVNALASARDSRLLADPNVVIYDQETAKIDSVREIPFQQLTQSAQGGTIGTTAFREAGITLTVTPQVSNEETLTLVVNPKFSVLAGLTATSNQPIIDRREYSGTVRVRSRETIVIGGMRQREFNKSRAGVPYLMNIKGIGELFKNKDVTTRESELVVFLTPEILDLQYLGRDREHTIYGAASGALDTVMYPRIPELPCPIEDWKRRCGCQNKACKGDCEKCRQCRVSHMYQETGVMQAPSYGHPDYPAETQIQNAPPYPTEPQYQMAPMQQEVLIEPNLPTPTEQKPVQIPETKPSVLAPTTQPQPQSTIAPEPPPVRVEEFPKPAKPALEIPDPNAPPSPDVSNRRRPVEKQANAPATTPVIVRETSVGMAYGVQVVADQRLNMSNPLRKTVVQTVNESASPLPTLQQDPTVHSEPGLLPNPTEVTPKKLMLKPLPPIALEETSDSHKPTLTPRSIFVPLPPITREIAE